MPKTMLLADDSVTIQKVVGISFASEDIEITTVDNGDAALAKARELRPDVILADVVMPGLSGYEVCEQIKAEPSLRHIPVLLLTGTFEAFDETRATAAGAAGHVAKPFEAQTLVDRVHQLLASAPAPEAATPRADEAVPGAAPTAAQETPDPGATTDAFDFFSDDDGGTADGGALADGPLDLDEPDAAFAFGDDDIAATLAEPQAPPPDATVAIAADAAEGPEAPEALDFSFGEAPSNALDAPLSPDDLGHTTLLDPAAGADLDVSSSDLAVDLSSGPGMATPRAEVPAPAVEPGVEDQFGDDPFAPAEPVEADGASLDTTEPEPLGASAPVPPLPRDLVMEALSPAPVPAEDSLSRPFGAEPDAGDTIPGRDAAVPMAPPPIEAEPLDAEPMDAEPLEAEPIDASEMEADLPMAEPISPEAIEPPPTPAFDSAALDRAELGDAALGADASAAQTDTLSPAMRDELHDTLEKIAWDAFGQVTEKVVREAIERIERVAWEVVPKLAETLIQEEIRRLKGGNGSD